MERIALIWQRVQHCVLFNGFLCEHRGETNSGTIFFGGGKSIAQNVVIQLLTRESESEKKPPRSPDTITYQNISINGTRASPFLPFIYSHTRTQQHTEKHTTTINNIIITMGIRNYPHSSFCVCSTLCTPLLINLVQTRGCAAVSVCKSRVASNTQKETVSPQPRCESRARARRSLMAIHISVTSVHARVASTTHKHAHRARVRHSMNRRTHAAEQCARHSIGRVYLSSKLQRYTFAHMSHR